MTEEIRGKCASEVPRNEGEDDNGMKKYQVANDGIKQTRVKRSIEDNKQGTLQTTNEKILKRAQNDTSNTEKGRTGEHNGLQNEDEIMLYDSSDEELEEPVAVSNEVENVQKSTSTQENSTIAQQQRTIGQSDTGTNSMRSSNGQGAKPESLFKQSSTKTGLVNKNTSTIKTQPRVRFDLNPQIKIITTMETDKSTAIQERGVRMVEDTEKFTTPTRIEYNLNNTIVKFNIREAVKELFLKFSKEDPTIRILTLDKSKVVWEVDRTLEENNTFQENFQMREQSYRKGNKKVTLYCLVESRLTINRLKYATPVKNHIFDNNIWIRPDLYSTQIVSCPGFFTLVHPKMTNKSEFTNELIEALKTVEVNNSEKVVQEWNLKRNQDNKLTNTVIPKFHIETNQRKWGDITTEVLSLHCSMEDAQFLKYLLAETGTKQKLPRGLFIPTGIHLMEGKEVLRKLLKEHQEYILTLTSCQIGGISTQDMVATDGTLESIQQIFLKMDGVKAVEKMYHTDYSRQWMLVIEKDKIHKLVEQVQQNLSRLYNRRTTKNPRLITYKLDTGATGYRLMATEGSHGKIGSYAEVLKRRFPTEGDDFGSLPTSSKTIRSDKYTSMRKEGTELKDKTEGEKDGEGTKNSRYKKSGINDKNISIQQYNQGHNSPENRTGGAETQNTDVERHTTNIRKEIQLLEKGFNDRLLELEQSNKRLLETMDNRIAKRVEKTMDKKADHISDVTADMVTKRLMKAITGITKGSKHKQIQEDNQASTNRVTQESPMKAGQNDTDMMDVDRATIITEQESYLHKDTTKIIPDTTNKHYTAQTDQPHDTTQGSETSVK